MALGFSGYPLQLHSSDFLSPKYHLRHFPSILFHTYLTRLPLILLTSSRGDISLVLSLILLVAEVT